MPNVSRAEYGNQDWALPKDDGNAWPRDTVTQALLSDLRAELRMIRAEAQAQTKLLRSIRRAMPPRPRISLGELRKAAR